MPVVVCAAGALLALKTVGLVTHGGYVLTGVRPAIAAGAEAEGHGEVVLPSEPTLADRAPTLADGAPTFDPAALAESHGRVTEGGAGHTSEAGGAHGNDDAVAATACPSGAEGQSSCLPRGDAQAMQIGPDGMSQPLAATANGSPTEEALLERLAERRSELDAYAAELEMRASLMEAAEKRIEERAATMEALEAQISALVDARKAAEEELISGVVAMYQSMRPRDAAAIFNELDMAVLEQVARTMAPRKMAPILAEMTPTRAQELTVRLAAVHKEPSDEMSIDNLAALPQIVGQ
ncbi:hypothetical protein GCM10010862_45930 [Devosia nitrariae]|uniref:Magnesium transporter MgtE intracellular domain-containing protein n=1 Tax=Devosia nitrariae TaxID=2071872 RepID=A0ABQ5WC10_9HYPH|nr:hypothetical protein GCM10010862_45930 [Devosia nitrariae]